MLLLVYFILLYCLFNLRRGGTPGALLVGVYLVSLGCGLLIGYDANTDSFLKVLNLLFIAMTLTVFIVPWNRFPYRVNIGEPHPARLRTLTHVLLGINAISFVHFCIVVYFAFTTVTNYSAFKNMGESGGFIAELPLNHTLFLLALYLHPTAYFLIPLHFYYLAKGRYLYSLLALLFSLNIVLNGLMVFSRSGFLAYFLVYALYLPFFYPRLPRRARRAIKAGGLTLFSLAIVVFYAITANRFAEAVFYHQAAHSGSLVKNPIAYSLLDYLSQWYKNGNEVLDLYSFQTLKGELSSPLLLMLADRLNLINYRPEVIESTLYSLWGDYFDKFNGLVPNLVFDFGYLGTLFFAFCYWLALSSLRPVRGVLPFHRLLVLGSLFVLPSMGIFNSELKVVFYHLLLLFSLLVYGFMMTKSVTKEKNQPGPRRESALRRC